MFSQLVSLIISLILESLFNPNVISNPNPEIYGFGQVLKIPGILNILFFNQYSDMLYAYNHFKFKLGEICLRHWFLRQQFSLAKGITILSVNEIVKYVFVSDEELEPLISFTESTSSIFLRAINPIDSRSWRRIHWGWKILKAILVKHIYLTLVVCN